jgi:hypothetical protein
MPRLTKKEALTDNYLYSYVSMFNSMDSDDVILLLRDFHKLQNKEAGEKLIAKLDSMLEMLIQRVENNTR